MNDGVSWLALGFAALWLVLFVSNLRRKRHGRQVDGEALERSARRVLEQPIMPGAPLAPVPERCDAMWLGTVRCVRSKGHSEPHGYPDEGRPGPVVYQETTETMGTAWYAGSAGGSTGHGISVSAPRYFNRDGEPISAMAAARLMGDVNYCRIAETRLLNRLWVSTVWLGVAHGPNRDQLFETMVFRDSEDLDSARYATETEARAGHAAMVGKWGSEPEANPRLAGIELPPEGSAG